MNKNLRQAIEISPRELINKALELLEEKDIGSDTRCLIIITNKTGQSDDWKLEKVKSNGR